MKRRTFMKAMAGATATSLLPAAFWRSAVYAAGPARPGPSPYGPLRPADQHGIRLPAGFTSRVLATTGRPVADTAHVWHGAPDGGGCVADESGGWVYTSNAELEDDRGGAAAIRFAADGSIADAYTILSGTSRNCAGGMTPWSTWLSCEERGRNGKVYECDPFRPGQGVVRPLLGSFNHEAAAVDPATGDVYLTEDEPLGRLYRFVPTEPGDLSAGVLMAAAVDQAGGVRWLPTSTQRPDRRAATTPFAGGEGIHIGDGVAYIATKLDQRIWEFDIAASTIAVAYDCRAHPEGSLNAVDNVTVHPRTGRVFIAEDGGNMEIGVMSGSGDDRTMAALCRIEGQQGSEIAGLAFSPDGTRLYFSSQRGFGADVGVTYEITGPFDGLAVGDEPLVLAIVEGVHVRGGTHADENFAGARSLQVCTNSEAEYTRRALLSVPIPSPAEPYQRAILRVDARMWRGGPSTLDVFATDAEWDASTTTWNTQPEADGGPIAAFEVESTSPVRYEIDVTDHVNDLVERGATTASFSIRQADVNGPMAYLTGPAAAANRPELVLTRALDAPSGAASVASRTHVPTARVR